MQRDNEKNREKSVLKDKEKFTGDKVHHMGNKPTQRDKDMPHRAEDQKGGDPKK